MKRSSLISIAMVSILFGKGFSQISNNSPYSIYGIGDIGSRAGVLNRTMGGLGNTLIEPRHFNSSNPAAYSFTAEPTGDVGVYYSALQLYNGKEEQYRQDIGLQNFGLGIPFAKRFGIGFGLVPYSKVGYQATNVVNDPNAGLVTFRYNGEGGVNQFFFGGACSIIDNDSISFSVGANASYLFGSIYNYSRSIFENSEFVSTRIEDAMVFNDFIFDFGTIFRLKLSKRSQLIIGGLVNIPKDIKVTKSHLVESILSREVEIPIKVISSISGINGTVSITQMVSGGLGYRFYDKFFLGVEYKTQEWSSYKEDFGVPFDNSLLKNSSQISVGAAYTGMDGLGKDKKFWKYMDYRIGGRVGDTYLQLKGEQLREYGMSFGLGIPLFKSKSRSSINVGFEFGERGSTNNGLIRERWANAMIGLSIAPGYGDKWFYKRKYD